MPSFPASTFAISKEQIDHNLCVETFFSAFNGIFLGLALFVAPVVAVVGVEASPLELTILSTAFPVGAFLGPLWAYLGRRSGMKALVITTCLIANVPFFLLFWVQGSVAFTVLLTISQIMNSAMRMGQSSLYRWTYPADIRGRVLGRLNSWTYVTMVPTVLLTGWLLDKSREMYQVIYPLGGLCGLISCIYFSLLKVPSTRANESKRTTLRGNMQNIEHVIRSDRLYLLFQVAFFLAGGAFFMSRHVILLLTRERFGFSAFELSLCLSVIPQILLATASPLWGRILDRIGVIPSRLVISSLLTACLACYFFGLITGWSFMIYAGSVLLGFSNAGGQLTWFLASSLFAPRNEDVPIYNGIHFVLNGIRGLIMPWVGSILFVATGSGAILAATSVCLGSIPVLLQAMRIKDSRLGSIPRKSATINDESVMPPKPQNEILSRQSRVEL